MEVKLGILAKGQVNGRWGPAPAGGGMGALPVFNNNPPLRSLQKPHPNTISVDAVHA